MGVDYEVKNWQIMLVFLAIQKVLFPYLMNLFAPGNPPSPDDFGPDSGAAKLYKPPLKVNEKVRMGRSVRGERSDVKNTGLDYDMPCLTAGKEG